MPNATGPTVAAWVRWCIDHALAERMSLVLEGTFRDADVVSATVRRFAQAGYVTEAVVLAVRPELSRLDTFLRYVNVGEKRRREAVDRVAVMQFDRHGTRLWRNAQALLDDERTRLAVSEVAVPYGGCSEPSNVAAGGHSCPIRFRCVGCGHFRTDASYLPDLEAYLGDLLRNRERLLAATFDADDWARTEATPSDQEITKVRRLVERIRSELDETRNWPPPVPPTENS